LRADGHWYVIIVCDVGKAPPIKEGPAIGLDVGFKVVLADSEGETDENPRCLKQASKKLRRAQRKLSRRKKAAKAVAKQHLKIKRQRRDHAHKTARRYVDRYATIAVEDLRVCNMVKDHHLARAISDAGWSQFVEILDSKAESAGCQVYKVPPHFTSKLCSNCGEVVNKSLSVRTHFCPYCGYVADRDVNAARSILARAEPSYLNVGDGSHGARSHLL
jgi:putative transposase